MLERRLSLRLLAYWERARGQRLMPLESDIRAEDLHDVWEDCFMLQIIERNPLNFEVIHRGKRLHEGWPQVSHLEGSINTLLSKRGPMLEDGQIYDASGEVLKYRLCLLPLGDERQIRVIFGGTRFKVF